MKILFITALACEAKPVIAKYGLKRVPLSSRFELYENGTGEVILAVSGVGKENALAVTGFLMGRYAGEDMVQVINVGICGSVQEQKGQIYQCIQIKSATGERDLYPEYHGDLPLPCKSLLTTNEVVQDTEALPSEDLLVDMEGYGVAFGALAFCVSHQVLIVKVVSDGLANAKRVTPTEAESLVAQCIEVLAPWIEALQREQVRQEQKVQETMLLPEVTEALGVHFCTSTAMQLELKQTLRYACLVNRSAAEALAEEILQQEPVIGRGQGKTLFAQTRKRFCQLPWDAEWMRQQKACCLQEGTHRFLVVYVEEDIYDHPRTKQWLSRLPKAHVVRIRHYKDLFNRWGKQDTSWQKRNQCLVIAKKTGELVYTGAAMCHDFGSENFCYTSCVMNCIFDCEYCYLQGMYPCGHLVAFVNLEDIFEEAEVRAQGKEMYLSVSFDTDLLALEGLLGLCREWADFAATHPQILVELRTKGAGEVFLKPYLEEENEPCSNLVLSWSLSPRVLAEQCERGAATLSRRLAAVKQAMQQGFRVRLCFDPMIYFPSWQEAYQELLAEVKQELFEAGVPRALDVSVGVFRISQDYLKRMRRNREDAPLVAYPYASVAGHAQYEADLAAEMVQWMQQKLQEELELLPEKIFVWQE